MSSSRDDSWKRSAWPDTLPRRWTRTAWTAASFRKRWVQFRCYGIAPHTGYLAGDLLASRTAEGYLEVTPELKVVGFDNVYALGDVAAIDANKAGIAGSQAKVVAANIRAQLAGITERTAYTPAPPVIILPLGPSGGSGQLPDCDIASSELISLIKGQDMMITRYAELLNIPT